MYVYVLSKDKKPLMPTTRYGKVRRMLRDKQAKVVKRCPFTIQLLYTPKTNVVQNCTLGVDTGSKFIGASVYSERKILYTSQTQIRDDIKSKMDDRRSSRRNRRNRKTRYRKPRFLNRKNSTKLGRIPPSVRHKVQSHIDEIESCKKLMPISTLVLEVSQFDPHLMKNPALFYKKIKKWGYQKGFNYGFASRKEAVRHRDNYTCQICKAKGKNVALEVHHIIFKSQGGTDDEDNLVTLCKKCHNDIHTGKLIYNKKPKKMNLKYATHMNIIRSQLLKYYPNAIETFGFVTHENRNHLNLPKDHYLDACVIASGGKRFEQNNEIFYKKRVAKGSYKLSKGKRGEIKLPTGKIKGFRRFDKVKYLGNVYFVKSRQSKGYCGLMDVSGESISFSYMPRGWKTPKIENLTRLSARNTCLCISQKIAANTV